MMGQNTNKQALILIGGGGHCQACIDVLELTDAYSIKAIVDMPAKLGTTLLEYTLKHTDADLSDLIDKHKNVLITLGQIKNPESRILMFKKAEEMGASFPSPVSPLAYVSSSAKIEQGCIIMHHALINAGAKIGQACIVNSKGLVEHGAEIGPFCHISTGAIVNGEACIGTGVFIGSNAVIGQGVAVGSSSVIGAGAVVLKDVPADCTVTGYRK